MKIGLTLGKYAPFHKGHQLIIQTALNEMDKVIVIIYNMPEITKIPLSIRAGWIKQIYPQLEVIESEDGPKEVGNTLEIQRIHENYIKNTLKIHKVTAFYSSEFYGEHMSRALNAINRQVDPHRQQFPISGTKIRRNLYENRSFLHPLVYRSFITHIVFLGAPSTGKTTIARELAKIFKTLWMPEFGREYWEKHQINRRLSKSDLVKIAIEHQKREDEYMKNANIYLFTDTNAITTFMFGKYYHGNVLPELEYLAKNAESRYDIVFLCEDDIPYSNTWDRSGEVNRKWFQEQIRNDLKRRKIPVISLRGNKEERILKVKKHLSIYSKFK